MIFPLKVPFQHCTTDPEIVFICFSDFIFYLFLQVEELIETEQRRRRRETLEGGGGHLLGGNRINLEEEARELTRLKEQVENKVSRRQNI